jgi:hypothetical protein
MANQFVVYAFYQEIKEILMNRLNFPKKTKLKRNLYIYIY